MCNCIITTVELLSTTTSKTEVRLVIHAISLHGLHYTSVSCFFFKTFQNLYHHISTDPDFMGPQMITDGTICRYDLTSGTVWMTAA